MLAAFAGMSFAGTGYAADQTEAHALADTVVTAQRREKRDLDTPATTTIITAKEIEKAGYRNVFEAIDQQIGSTSTSYGEAGQDFGFAAGRIVLRGYGERRADESQELPEHGEHSGKHGRAHRNCQGRGIDALRC